MDKITIVLAMHGVPPHDFSRPELLELLGWHARLTHADGLERAALESRHADLDAKVRAWPRTAENDPFYVGSLDLAAHLRQATSQDVIVGFNEFCAPSLDEALDQAAARGATQVVVVTPMVTPGGEHSEMDIPAAIRRAQERHPGNSFSYAWPFDPAAVAQFLAAQVAQFARARRGASQLEALEMT